MTKLLFASAALAILTSKGSAQITVYTSEAAWQSAMVSSTLIDFDAFTGPISTQYNGLTFTGQQAGNPRAEARGFFQTPSNVLVANNSGNGGGGGFSVAMTTPTYGVGMWFYDLTLSGNALIVRDANTIVLGSVSLPSGLTGQWTFIGVTSQAGPIRSSQVLYRSSDFVAVDDFQYSPVPEPLSVAGLGLGLAALASRRKRT